MNVPDESGDPLILQEIVVVDPPILSPVRHVEDKPLGNPEILIVNLAFAIFSYPAIFAEYVLLTMALGIDVVEITGLIVGMGVGVGVQGPGVLGVGLGVGIEDDVGVGVKGGSIVSPVAALLRKKVLEVTNVITTIGKATRRATTIPRESNFLVPTGRDLKFDKNNLNFFRNLYSFFSEKLGWFIGSVLSISTIKIC